MRAAEPLVSRHRPRAAPRLLLLALLLAPGCIIREDEPDDFGHIGQLYIDYLAALDEVTLHQCGCAVEAGFYESVDECWAANGGPAQPPPLAECIAWALDGQSAAEESLSCLLDRQRLYVDCLHASTCDDGFAQLLCEDIFYQDVCPSIPYEVDVVVFEECFGYTPPPPFFCGDGTEIPESWVCDGAADCFDGSDELGCPPPPDSFMCGSGEYVPDWWVCDGAADCFDGSDELGCPTPEPPPDSFMCGSGETVPESWVCDGAADCADGSDELGCPPPPDSFMCGSGETVPESWVCDGFADCSDGSDEQDCPPPFTCGSGESVPNQWVCDGFPDCADGSDEVSCISML